MTSAKAGTIVPHVAFMQRNDGVSSWKTSAFTYDIAYPERVVSIEEIEDIINEVMIDDVYRLQKNTQPSDIWIDVGSHVGFFSIAAMQAGARVYMAIEADPDIAACTRYNTVMFKGQSVARGMMHNHVVDPFVYNDRVVSAEQLLDFNIDRFHDEVGRKCLKLDIQHSENDVFNSDDAYKLAEQYDVLVLEYHNEITSDVSTLLENIGWNITSITAHKDVQLCIPTTMIWAMSG
jgi:FkbM family methyltransferase